MCFCSRSMSLKWLETLKCQVFVWWGCGRKFAEYTFYRYSWIARCDWKITLLHLIGNQQTYLSDFPALVFGWMGVELDYGFIEYSVNRLMIRHLAIRPKLWGNCSFPQNFHTRRLGEITIFFIVFVTQETFFGRTEHFQKQYKRKWSGCNDINNVNTSDLDIMALFSPTSSCLIPMWLVNLSFDLHFWSHFEHANKLVLTTVTAQKIKLSIIVFFSKCDQIRRKLRIWSHLLENSLMENLFFMRWVIWQQK